MGAPARPHRLRAARGGRILRWRSGLARPSGSCRESRCRCPPEASATPAAPAACGCPEAPEAGSRARSASAVPASATPARAASPSRCWERSGARGRRHPHRPVGPRHHRRPLRSPAGRTRRPNPRRRAPAGRAQPPPPASPAPLLRGRRCPRTSRSSTRSPWTSNISSTLRCWPDIFRPLPAHTRICAPYARRWTARLSSPPAMLPGPASSSPGRSPPARTSAPTRSCRPGCWARRAR